MKQSNRFSSKAMKQTLAGTLAAGMLAVPSMGMAASSLPLTDISNNVNKNAILKLNYAGVLKGYTDGTFRPDKQVTRAEFAKVAVLALGYTDDQVKLLQGKTKFSDVPADHWATGYINLAVSQGIIKGYTNGTFKPNNLVNVAEALTVFVQGLHINVNPSTTGQWYHPYLLEANRAGIYDTKETPTNAAPRDVIAKYADKFMETSVYANGAYYDKDGNASGTYKRLPIVKAAVLSYDKSNDKLKLVGQSSEISIASNAQVYGNIVNGAEVEYIVKNGKIAFINVVTEDANIVEGIIKTGLNFTTAVGDEKKFKALVDGKEVVLEVESGVSVTRASIGKKFTAVVGDDGKITSITISNNSTKGLVEKTSTVSGSRAKKEIKVDGTTYELASGAGIYGKAHPKARATAGTFSEIEKGDLVELTLDVNGKVSEVQYTKLSVTAPITIDTDDNTISFDNYDYDVLTDTDLYVDEKSVSELEKLKDDEIAILTFDEEGNVTKVEQGTAVLGNMQIADTTGYSLTAAATVKVDGKVYTILPTAKLTIDGKSVYATSIANDQLNDYRITTWKTRVGTKDIVELAAEKQTVKGYVTSQTSKTVKVNGKVYDLLPGVSIDDDAETNDKEYTLTLNIDGKVKAVSGAAKTVSGVVDEVEILDENGRTTSVRVQLDGKDYTSDDKEAVSGLDQFEFATLTLDRDGHVTRSSVEGKKAYTNVAFKGIESRVNGVKYLYFTDYSSVLKLTNNFQVKYYDGSDLKAGDIGDNDSIDIWTNSNNEVYLIVVEKR